MFGLLSGRRASKDPKEPKDPKDPGKSQLRRRATEDDGRSGTNKTSQSFLLRRADSIAVPTSKQSDSSSQKSRSSSKRSSDEGRGRPRRSFLPISTSTSAPVTESFVNAEPATSVDSEEPVFIKTPRSGRSEDGGNSPHRNDPGDRKDEGDRRRSNSKDSKEKERDTGEQPREATPTVKDRFIADISSPGFSQFPMQYDGSIPGPGPSPLVPPSPNLGPPVQQQFPGQSPPYAGHPASGAPSAVVPPSPNFDPHVQQQSPGPSPPYIGQPGSGAPSPMVSPLPNFDPRVHQQFPGQFPMQYDGSVPAAGGPNPVAPPSPNFDPHVHQQFPGQFPPHVGQPAAGAPSPVVPLSPNLNPGVQQQFPGQLPPYVGQPPRPHNPAGEAADYYGDHGESVLTQPGVRPNPPPLIVGAEPHLMPAAATPNPPPEPSSMGQVGAAASYYANNPELDQAVEQDQQQVQQQQQQQHVKPPGLAPAASSPLEPPKPPRPEMPHQPSASTAPTSAAGGSSSTTPGQSTTSHSHGVGIALGAAVVGAAAGYAMGHHHSSSSDSTPQYSPTTTYPHPYYNEAPTETTAQPGHHDSSSHTNTAMLGTGVAAGAAGYAAASAAHPYHAHGMHTPSSSSSSASQSGSMVFVRRPNRPFDKVIDWWRDTEGVGQFEEYTERIGICKDCFEPGTSPKDAPRRHHYRGRRRSSGGSSSNRIHKVSSSSSSSSSGSSRCSGKSAKMRTAAWLGAAALAGYVAKTLFDKMSFNNLSDGRSKGEKDENTNRRSERSRSRDRVEKGAKKMRSRSTPRTRKERRQSSDSSDSSYVRSRASKKGEKKNKKKKKRQSSSSDSSGSYIDISRSNDMSGLTGFFSAPSQNQHRSGRRHTSDKSVSSSSTDEDLAFGPAFLRKPESSKSDKRKKKETKNKDRILGLGVVATTLMETSSVHGSSKNRKESIAAKESQSRPRRQSDDVSSAPTDGDSQREDAASRASSASAYDGGAAVDSSPESPASEPGTSKWGWLWGSKKGKERRESTSSDEYGSTALEASEIHQSQDATSSADSLQPVFPEPTADPSQYDATPIMSPSFGSAMVPPPSQPPRLVQPGQSLLQQPQPITPVSQSEYSPQSGSTQSHPAPTDPPVFTDPFASRDSSQFQDAMPRQVSSRAPRRRETLPVFPTSRSEEFQPSALERGSTMRDQESLMQLDPEEQEDREWRADRRDRKRRERESSRQDKKLRSIEKQDGARLDADRRERRPRERAKSAQNYSYPASSPESQQDSPKENKRRSSSPSGAAPAAVGAIGGATTAASVAGKDPEDDASEGSRNRHEERREKRREGWRPTSESEEDRQPSKLSPILEEEEQQPQPLVQLVDREEDLRTKTRTESPPPAKIPTSRITSNSSAGPVHDSYQAFFAPEELRHTRTDVDPRERPGAPRIIEIEPANERFAREMARSSSEGKDSTTGKQHTDLPWPVPQLKLTEPTPPNSHNGSVRDGTSPVVASVEMVDKEKGEVGDRQEPERQSPGSRVYRGKQQMHEYEVSPSTLTSETDSKLAKEAELEPEPKLSDGDQEEGPYDTSSVVTTTSDKSTSDQDAPNSAVEPKTSQEPAPQETDTPGTYGDDIEFAATLAAGAAAAGFDPSIVTDDPTYHKRSSPLGSEEKGTYHHSWTENDAPPVQDFKEGQTEKPTHSYDQGAIPHKSFIEGQELSAELEQVGSASTGKDVYPHTPDEQQAAEEPSIARQDIEQLRGEKKEPSAVISQSPSLQGTLEQPEWKAETKRDKDEHSSADEASLREVQSQPEVDEHDGGYSSRIHERKERGRRNRNEKIVEADRVASDTEKKPKPSADGEQPFLGERPEMPAESTANTTPGDNDGGASGLPHPSSSPSRADDPVATAVAVTEGLGLILPMSGSRSRSAASPSSVENAVDPASKCRSRTPSPSLIPEQDQEQEEPQQQARPRTRTPDSALTSSTAVPLTFRPPPPIPGVRRMSSPAITTPSPTTPSPTRSRHRRPNSTEFKNVREWRPLWLVERHSPGKHEIEPEGPLPSLPSSKTSSRSASDEDLRASSPRKDSPPSWPFQDPGQFTIKRRRSFGLRISTDQGPAYDQEDDTVGPQHPTPTAISFTPTRPPPKKKLKYEFHSPSELLQDPSLFAELPGSTTLGKLPSIESSTVGGKGKGKEKEGQAPENKTAVQELDLDLDLGNLSPLPESWPSSPTIGTAMEQETAATAAPAHDREGGASSPSPPAVPADEQVPRSVSLPMDQSEFAAVADVAATSSADEKTVEPEDKNELEQAEQVPVIDTTAPAVDEHEERQRASSPLPLTPKVLGSVSPPMSESRFASIVDATIEEAAMLTEAVRHSPLLAGPEAEPESRSVPPSSRTGAGFGFGWRDIVDVVTSTVESFAHGKQPGAGHESALPEAEKEEVKEKDQEVSKPEIRVPAKEEGDTAAEKIPGDPGDEDPFITDVDAVIANAEESTVDEKPATGDESVPMQAERENEQYQASKPDVVDAPVREEDSWGKIAEEKAAGEDVTSVAASKDGVNDNILEDDKREISNVEVPKDVSTVEESTPTATAQAAPAPRVEKDMSSEYVKSVEHRTEILDTPNTPDTAAETQEATPFEQVADPEPEKVTSDSMPEAGKEIISDETRQPVQSATEGQETPQVADTAPKAEPSEQLAAPGLEPEETAQDDMIPPETAASVSKKKRNKRRRKNKGSSVSRDHQPYGDTSKPEDIGPSREPGPVSEEREEPPKPDDELSREMVSEQEGEEPASTADSLETSREPEPVPVPSQPAIPAVHAIEDNDDDRLLPGRTYSSFDPILPQFRPDHELIDDEQVESPRGAEDQERILSFDPTLPQFRPDHELISDEQIESLPESEEHEPVSSFDLALPQHRPNDDLIDHEQVESWPAVEEQEPVKLEDEGDASLKTAPEEDPAKSDSSLDKEADGHEPGDIPGAEDEGPVKLDADYEASRQISSEEPAKQDSSEKEAEAREPAPLTDVEVPVGEQPTVEAEETKNKDISSAMPGPVESTIENGPQELTGKERKKAKKAKRKGKGSSVSENQQHEAARKLEDDEPSREPEPAPQEKEDEPPKPEAEVSSESHPEEEKEELVKPGTEADIPREAAPPEESGKPDSDLSLEQEADAREPLSAAEQTVEQPAVETEEESSDDDASLVGTEDVDVDIDVAKAGPATEKTVENESRALTKKERKKAKKKKRKKRKRKQKEAAVQAEAAVQEPDLEDRQSSAPAEASMQAAVSEEQVSAPAEPSLSEAGQDQPLSAPAEMSIEKQVPENQQLSAPVEVSAQEPVPQEQPSSAPADASVPEQIPENLRPSIPGEQSLQGPAPQVQSVIRGAYNVEPEKAAIGGEVEAGDKAVESKEPSAAPCVGKDEAAAADDAQYAESRAEQKSEPDPPPGSEVQVAQPGDVPLQTNPEENPQEKSKNDNEDNANRNSLEREPDDYVLVDVPEQQALAASGEAHEAAAETHQPTPAADAVERDAGDDTILDESKQPSLSPVENEPEEANGDQPHVLAQTDLVPALEPWGSTPPTKNEDQTDKKKKRQVPALAPRQHEEGLESECPVPVGETTVDTVADTTVPAQLVPQLTSQEPEQQLEVENDTQAEPETKTDRRTVISDEQAQVAVAEEESKMSPAQIEKTKDEDKSPSTRPSQVFEELARNAFARPAAPAQSSSSAHAIETEAPAAVVEELPTSSGQEAQTSDETESTTVPHEPSPSQVPPTEDPVKDEASGSQSAKSKKKAKKDKKRRQSHGVGDEEAPASSANPEAETEQQPAEPESSLPTTTEPKPAVADDANHSAVAVPAEQAEDEKPAEHAVQDQEEQPAPDAPSTEPAKEENNDDAQPSSKSKKKKAKKDKKKRQSQSQQPSEDAKAPPTPPDEPAIKQEKGTPTADEPNVEEKEAEPSAADEPSAKDKDVKPSEAAVEQPAETPAEELQPATSDEKEGKKGKKEQVADTDMQAVEHAETGDTTEPVKQDDQKVDNVPFAPAADTELATAVIELVEAPELDNMEAQVEEPLTAEATEPVKCEQKGDDLSASAPAAEPEADSAEPERPQSAEPEPEKDNAEDMPSTLESETPAAVPKASRDELPAEAKKEAEPEATSAAPKDEEAPILEVAPESEAAPTTGTETEPSVIESAEPRQSEKEEQKVEEPKTAAAADPVEDERKADDLASTPAPDTEPAAESAETEVPQVSEPEQGEDQETPSALPSETPATAPEASENESPAEEKPAEPESTPVAPKNEETSVPEAAPTAETEMGTPALMTPAPESAKEAQGEDGEKIVPEQGSQVKEDKESAPPTETPAVAEEGFISAKARMKKAKKEKKKRQSMSLQDDAHKATADETPADEPSASAAPDQTKDTIETGPTPPAEKNSQEAPQEPETTETPSPPQEIHDDKDGKEEQSFENYDNKTEEKEKGPELTNEMPPLQVEGEQQPEMPLASEATTTSEKIAEEITATSPDRPPVEEPELNPEPQPTVKSAAPEETPSVEAEREQPVKLEEPPKAEESSAGAAAEEKKEEESGTASSKKKKKKDKKKRKTAALPDEGSTAPEDAAPASTPAEEVAERLEASQPEDAVKDPSNEQLPAIDAERAVSADPRPEPEPSKPAEPAAPDVEDLSHYTSTSTKKKKKDKKKGKAKQEEVPPEGDKETSEATPDVAAEPSASVPIDNPLPAGEGERAPATVETEREQLVSAVAEYEPAAEPGLVPSGEDSGAPREVANEPEPEAEPAQPAVEQDIKTTPQNEPAPSESEKDKKQVSLITPAETEHVEVPPQEEKAPAVEAKAETSVPMSTAAAGDDETVPAAEPEPAETETVAEVSTTEPQPQTVSSEEAQEPAEDVKEIADAPQPEEPSSITITPTHEAKEKVEEVEKEQEPEAGPVSKPAAAEVISGADQEAAVEAGEIQTSAVEQEQPSAGADSKELPQEEQPEEQMPTSTMSKKKSKKDKKKKKKGSVTEETNVSTPAPQPEEKVQPIPTETEPAAAAREAAAEQVEPEPTADVNQPHVEVLPPEPVEERAAEELAEKASPPEEPAEQPAELIRQSAEEPTEKTHEPERLAEPLEQPSKEPTTQAADHDESTEQPAEEPVEEPTKTASEPEKSSEPADQLAEGPTENVHQPEEPVEPPVEKQVERIPEPEEPADDFWTILGFKKKKAKKGKGGQDISNITEPDAKDAAPERLSQKASKKAKKEKGKATDDAIVEPEHKEDPSVPAPVEESLDVSPDELEPVAGRTTEDSLMPAAPLEETLPATEEGKAPGADEKRHVDAPVALDPVDVPLPTAAQDIQLPTDVPERNDTITEAGEEAAGQPPEPEPEAEKGKVTEEPAQTEPLLEEKEPEAVQRDEPGAQPSKNENVPLSTSVSKGKERKDMLDIQPEIEAKPDKDAPEQAASDRKPKAEDPAEPTNEPKVPFMEQEAGFKNAAGDPWPQIVWDKDRNKDTEDSDNLTSTEPGRMSPSAVDPGPGAIPEYDPAARPEGVPEPATEKDKEDGEKEGKTEHAAGPEERPSDAADVQEKPTTFSQPTEAVPAESKTESPEPAEKDKSVEQGPSQSQGVGDKPEAEPRPLARQGSILSSFFPSLERGWFRRAAQPSTDDSAAKSKALNELAEEETGNRDSAIPVSEASHKEPARESGHTRSERMRGGRPAWDISVEVDPTYNISILSDGPDGDSDSVEIRWNKDKLRQRRSLESADNPSTPRADIDKTTLRRAATFHGRHDGPRPWTPERETSLTPPRTPLDPIREEPHGSAAGASTARGGTPRESSVPGPLIRASPDRPRQGSVGSASSIKSPATPPPSLRRASRVTGDLRTAATRHEQEKAADAERGSREEHKDPQAPSDLDLLDVNLERIPSSSTYDPVTDKGKRPLRGMTDVYEGWGENPGSPRSPSRPHSIRRRRSILQVQELEARLEQLISENRLLVAAKEEAESRLAKVSVARRKSDQALNNRDADIRDKEAEINQLQSSVDWLRGEVARLTASNDEITAQRENAVQELQDLRSQHSQLAAGMEDIVRDHINTALSAKNQEIERLRGELQSARDKTLALQRQITAAMSSRDDDNVLIFLDENHFEAACQKLCHHVQQWVVRFSKHSDLRRCRMLHEVRDDKIADRFDNAILDGTDVDTYLADRVRRRDVFMAVVMAMVWDFIFTRYLFGMDREQRQKLKSLEKQLSEVGTKAAVQRWRATTLTLLSKRPAFEQQLAHDIEAVALEIFGTLSRLLPPPPAAEGALLESLRRLLKYAARLSIEMRTQRAEYVMLPPLQPEYDQQGELVRTVRFNASLMNERSGSAVSNEALQQAIVRMVLFPLVVRKGDDRGEGNDEIVVYPAQVLVARDGTPGSRATRLASSERTDTPSDMLSLEL
ncbi:hypothetical protein VTN00DRAFT_2545 [Thermoascus crustaceus]|uniref:uncharacterized protein n=1 Tax=Thermoascus crustaceus TaxID=5088 RepID=UPI00374208D0